MKPHEYKFQGVEIDLDRMDEREQRRAFAKIDEILKSGLTRGAKILAIYYLLNKYPGSGRFQASYFKVSPASIYKWRKELKGSKFKGVLK